MGSERGNWTLRRRHTYSLHGICDIVSHSQWGSPLYCLSTTECHCILTFSIFTTTCRGTPPEDLGEKICEKGEALTTRRWTPFAGRSASLSNWGKNIARNVATTSIRYKTRVYRNGKRDRVHRDERPSQVNKGGSHIRCRNHCDCWNRRLRGSLHINVTRSENSQVRLVPQEARDRRRMKSLSGVGDRHRRNGKKRRKRRTRPGGQPRVRLARPDIQIYITFNIPCEFNPAPWNLAGSNPALCDGDGVAARIDGSTARLWRAA